MISPVEISLSNQRQMCQRLGKLYWLCKSTRSKARHFIDRDTEEKETLFHHLYRKFLSLAHEFGDLKRSYESQYGPWIYMVSETEALVLLGRMQQKQSRLADESAKEKLKRDKLQEQYGKGAYNLVGWAVENNFPNNIY